MARPWRPDRARLALLALRDVLAVEALLPVSGVVMSDRIEELVETFLEDLPEGELDFGTVLALARDVESATIIRCAREADCAALEKPQNAHKGDPRAAFKSGACRAAWRIRELKNRGPQ